MKALVVYDTKFGNTEKIAQAMGAALGSQADVTIVRVGDVKPEHLVGLNALLVGSPTWGGRPTPAIKAWLKTIAGDGLKGVKTAGFDTRGDLSQVHSRILLAFVGMFGNAAGRIAALLVERGGSQALPPDGFVVLEREGPLKDGEMERAAAWARQVL
jgi:flavodoxin I